MRKHALLAAAAVAGLVGVAQAAIVINPSTVAFTDISVTGTAVPAPTLADDSEHTITGATLTGLGFAGNELLAGGVSIRLGNNGGALWGNSATDTFASATDVGAINRTDFGTMVGGNSSFSTPTGNGGLGPRQFIAPLWDDTTPATGGAGSLRFQVIAGDLYVQWSGQDHFNATGAGTVQFQMIVRGGRTIASGLSLVDFVYNDTQYAPNQYQNDGGSATIGYKNWALNANANDVEFGVGGGNNTLSDPAFGDATMKPKVAGYLAADNAQLTHALTISGVGGVVPEPASLSLLAGGALMAVRRRRR
ncbi:MAG: PEP-CTERM sorting domain-containing protein [Anaerolineae bacterium]|nr:PEP-CTERM sorting domain-containing protein [Phycisphaerae bacterium]